MSSRCGSVLAIISLLIPLSVFAQGGHLDGLEMDVLGPGEAPGESMSRISLPEALGRQHERLDLGIGPANAPLDRPFGMESTEPALESSNALSGDSNALHRPPEPPPLPPAPAQPVRP